MLKLLGLATIAKKTITGEEFTVKAIKSNTAKFVFLASDAGVNTTKKVKEKCEFYNVIVCTNFSSEELSKSIGNKNRKVIAVTDIGFANKMKERM